MQNKFQKVTAQMKYPEINVPKTRNMHVLFEKNKLLDLQPKYYLYKSKKKKIVHIYITIGKVLGSKDISIKRKLSED